MSRAEFGITPLRGYRKWHVRDRRLVSHYNQAWPLRAPAQAACTHCSRAGLPIPSGTRHGHFAGEGCGLYAWNAPEFVGRPSTLLSKRIQCWGVVAGWGRVLEHEKGFRALCMRPLALSPIFPIDLKLLKDMAAAYEIPLLMNVGEVRRAFPPLTAQGSHADYHRPAKPRLWWDRFDSTFEGVPVSRTTTESAHVVNVAAGVESTDRTAPVRDGRHQALAVLIGKWINEGHTIETAEIPSVPILTSDVYEWAPGGFFVVHSAFGKIGETSVGGVEIIGVDGEAYGSTFYDSFGNVHRSRLEIEGDVIRWIGDRTRCTVTMTDDGMTQVAHHESSADGVSWTASMDVTLRKVA